VSLRPPLARAVGPTAHRHDRRILSSILASGRLDGQEPSRAFVAAFIDRMLGRITREEFLAGDHHLPPCTRTDYQPVPTPTTPAAPPTPPPLP